MRIARFSHHDEVSYGLVVHAEGADAGVGAANGSSDLVVAQIAGHPFGATPDDLQLTGTRYALSEVNLLAPILPSKVVCIGKNYVDHVEEMGGDKPPEEPVIFLKPSTSVCGPGDPIRRPVGVRRRRTQRNPRSRNESPAASWLSRTMRSCPSRSFFTRYWQSCCSIGSCRTIV